MQWHRWHKGTVNRREWHHIAANTGQSVGNVFMVYVAMRECASDANKRGTLELWTDQHAAGMSNLDVADVAKIRLAMQGLVLDGDSLIGWPEEQYEATAATIRKRRQRERERAAQSTVTVTGNADVTPGGDLAGRPEQQPKVTSAAIRKRRQRERERAAQSTVTVTGHADVTPGGDPAGRPEEPYEATAATIRKRRQRERERAAQSTVTVTGHVTGHADVTPERRDSHEQNPEFRIQKREPSLPCRGAGAPLGAALSPVKLDFDLPEEWRAEAAAGRRAARLPDANLDAEWLKYRSEKAGPALSLATWRKRWFGWAMNAIGDRRTAPAPTDASAGSASPPSRLRRPPDWDDYPMKWRGPAVQWIEGGAWAPSNGPPPGRPGCKMPAALQTWAMAERARIWPEFKMPIDGRRASGAATARDGPAPAVDADELEAEQIAPGDGA